MLVVGARLHMVTMDVTCNCSEAKMLVTNSPLLDPSELSEQLMTILRHPASQSLISLLYSVLLRRLSNYLLHQHPSLRLRRYDLECTA